MSRRAVPPAAILFVALVLAGCAREKPRAALPEDVGNRLYQARVAALALRPPAVATRLEELASAGDSTALRDSTTALAVWIESRGGDEGLLVGIWLGDTTMVQVAGGTGLRGFARPGQPGAELLRLARAEAHLFHAAPDVLPPAEGRTRLWIITPAGTRLRDEPTAAVVDEARASTPFLQEARLLLATSLGDVLEFEASTSATLESLDVTPPHPAGTVARALGLDPDRLR